MSVERNHLREWDHLANSNETGEESYSDYLAAGLMVIAVLLFIVAMPYL